MGLYDGAIRTLKNTKTAYTGPDYPFEIDNAIKLLEAMTGEAKDLIWNVESKDTPHTDHDYQLIARDMFSGKSNPFQALRHMATVARTFERGHHPSQSPQWPADVLTRLLKWALTEIEDNLDKNGDGTPDHVCGYVNAPDTGYCKFHDNYWCAKEAVGDAGAEEAQRGRNGLNVELDGDEPDFGGGPI